MSQMKHQVLKNNVEDIAESNWSKGDTIAHSRKRIIPDKGINKLYCDIYEIPPEMSNWPSHFHTSNEEVFFILEGEGEVITKESTFQVRPGDVVRFPAGEKGTHQLRNISETKKLRYLDFGTTNLPDLVFMPDENKIELFEDNKEKTWNYTEE